MGFIAEGLLKGAKVGGVYGAATGTLVAVASGIGAIFAGPALAAAGLVYGVSTAVSSVVGGSAIGASLHAVTRGQAFRTANTMAKVVHRATGPALEGLTKDDPNFWRNLLGGSKALATAASKVR